MTIFEKNSLVKDITKRESIIHNYKATGFPDRTDEINIIQQLRIKT